MVLSTAGARLLSQPLLACNVYISAGGLPRHTPILLDLLRETQDHCASLTSQKYSPTQKHDLCIVVHAFSDVVYNRSSFHLAGSEQLISDVVSKLVRVARQKLVAASENNSEGESEASQSEKVDHPYVGLVDHISVMPLADESSVGHKNTGSSDEYQPSSPSGRAARNIGKSISNADVFYYGNADAHQTPLAEVRRKKTKFFQSGGLKKNTEKDSMGRQNDVAIVGAPLQFVENFNIRLTQHCDKKTAQSLTRFVRERDGGLRGVEALTLPYSNGRFEIACNLLEPQLGSSEAIEQKVLEWVSNMSSGQRVLPEGQSQYDSFVETAYRVGTTAEQCLESLTTITESDNEALKRHNNELLETLERYLASQ